MIIADDFNTDLKCNSYIKNKWDSVTNSLDLQQIVEESTRITERTETLIDHVYLSNPFSANNIQANVSKTTISDHFPVIITFRVQKGPKKGMYQYQEYRNFKIFNENNFLLDLQSTDWQNIHNTNDLNTALTDLVAILITVTNKHAPIKTRRVKTKRKTKWIDR